VPCAGKADQSNAVAQGSLGTEICGELARHLSESPISGDANNATLIMADRGARAPIDMTAL
jgi:hypothetical protein